MDDGELLPTLVPGYSCHKYQVMLKNYNLTFDGAVPAIEHCLIFKYSSSFDAKIFGVNKFYEELQKLRDISGRQITWFVINFRWCRKQFMGLVERMQVYPRQ
jgi:hypothetical protein